jgi:hypothetical protein
MNASTQLFRLPYRHIFTSVTAARAQAITLPCRRWRSFITIRRILAQTVCFRPTGQA